MRTALMTRSIGKFLHKANRRYLRVEHEDWFVRRGRTAEERKTRLDLAGAFRRIDGRVKCAHSALELLMMADYLLESPLDDPMVECGCFKGGSTVKLSLVARATGRRLLVCDSFEGLPSPKSEDRFLLARGEPYQPGMFAGTLDEVTRNVEAHGAPEVCQYVKGYFSDTLPGLAARSVGFVFIDVDLISSARDCLLHLWPRLRGSGRLYTHEARDITFLRGVMDRAWWREALGQVPPLMVGAGYGCGEGAPQLAYLETPPED